MNRLLASLACSASVTLAIAACTAPLDGEDTASSTSALMPGCGAKLAEVDGVWAYSNGEYTNTGVPCAGKTAVGAYAYQCVELAQRYMNVRFGIAPLWPVAAAAEMCSQQPAGVTTHWIGSGYTPKRGDLVVWGATSTNPWGHVAVVRRVVNGSIEIVEQNASIGGSQGVRTIPAGGGGIACYVSANANTEPGGVATSSATCGLGDGIYCGKNGGGSDPSTLYRCTGGTAAPIERCALGCEWRPDMENDRCRTSAACPYGDGRYCGGNGISGASNVLFECARGTINALERCANGCEPMPVGYHDRCR